MTTYNEAKNYANAIRRRYTGALYIMTNGERFVVAKGLEDRAYAEECGYKLAKEEEK